MSDTFGCVKNTIRLHSGLYFDLADPKPEQFTLADIAGALSKICRFGGQCERFYSVAEHCVHCAEVAKADGASILVQQACLLHDAAEAFAGDVVKPLKIMLPEYAAIEKRIETVIAEKYDVNIFGPPVREIDHAMLIAERRAMFTSDKVLWAGEDKVRQLCVWFECWGPAQANAKFLAAALALGISDAHGDRDMETDGDAGEIGRIVR